MAKGRIIIPPKKNIGKTIKSIVKKGPKMPQKQVLSKAKSQSFVQQVQKSQVPKPSQNQRGKVKSTDSKDLTR
jgi:hypothetical protein